MIVRTGAAADTEDGVHQRAVLFERSGDCGVARSRWRAVRTTHQTRFSFVLIATSTTLGEDHAMSRIRTPKAPRRDRKPARRRHPPTANRAIVRSTSPFGLFFFQSQLGILVTDRCPEGAGALPLVTLHLASGDSLEVRYVLMLGEDWVALGVPDEDAAHVRTELVPYEAILRVTIRPSGPDDRLIGFEKRLTKIIGQNGETKARSTNDPAAEGKTPADQHE
jgi:hypothetical protein